MQIGLFLKKFESLIHEKDIPKKLICEVLFQNLKKEFQTKDIKVHKGVLYINTEVFVKNAILFKKDIIIKELSLRNIQIKEIK